ncbi:MAG: pilin N-terminal domain-containing protein [Hominenteromicrobium sp.]
MRNRIISLLAALVFACLLSTAVSAHNVPDKTQEGVITVTMHAGETVVPGGSLTLYQVGEVFEENGNYCFVPAADFSGCGETLDDVQSPELAARLAAYAAEKKLEGTTLPIGADGTVRFEKLEIGLYLLVQNTAAEGYAKANPFLVTVPKTENGEYVYTVDASPKVALQPEDTPAPSPTPGPEEPNLPQTGQLNWPVPVLAAAGLLLFAAGWAMCFRRKKDTHEK